MHDYLERSYPKKINDYLERSSGISSAWDRAMICLLAKSDFLCLCPSPATLSLPELIMVSGHS